MRGTLKNQRKALMALALGFAIAAIFATTASARVGTDLVPGQYAADLEAEQAMLQAPSFSRITSAAELYAGRLEPASSPSAELPYLSWGATADDLGPFKASDQNRSGAGVTPTNLARAYHHPEQSVSPMVWAYREPVQSVLSGAGVTPVDLLQGERHEAPVATAQGTVGEWQLSPTEAAKIGVGPAFESKTVERATVSASSDSIDRGDLALGFGVGLILATACAIALAMTRDRRHTRMAHS